MKHALGEISDGRARARCAAPRPPRRAQRCATSTRSSGTSDRTDTAFAAEASASHGRHAVEAPSLTPTHPEVCQGANRIVAGLDPLSVPKVCRSVNRSGRPLRVVHCPVNTAGIRGRTSRRSRRKGIDAKLVVFERYSLPPRGRLEPRPPRRRCSRRQATQWRALAKLLPRTDVFHFYFGLTLVPKSLQFPILRAAAQEVASSTSSARTSAASRPSELAYGSAPARRSSAPTTRSAGCPRPRSCRPGSTSGRSSPCRRATEPGRVILHAPSSRQRKGTEHVVAAVRGAPADLEIVEGLHHDEARRRYAHADIVVDQLNAGWYGLFAIEAMALGKPVVASSTTRRVAPHRGGLRARAADRPRHEGDARRRAPAARCRLARGAPSAIGAASRAYVERVHDIDGWPTACSTSTLASRCSGSRSRSSASRATPLIYGLGGIVSRILAILLLPLYTHYLPTSATTASVEIVTAATAVLAIVLQMGISSAFFRFYFDTNDAAGGCVVVRTSFWFTMGMATLGLRSACVFADPIAHAAPARRRPGARPRRRRRALGADELRAADVAVPRRGALGRRTRSRRRERPDHRRRDGPVSSPCFDWGAIGLDRRQLHRHAHRLLRAPRLPPRAARARSSTGRCCARCSTSGCRSSRPRSRSGGST